MLSHVKRRPKFQSPVHFHRKSPMKTCARAAPIRTACGRFWAACWECCVRRSTAAGYGAVIPYFLNASNPQTISGEGTQQFCMDASRARRRHISVLLNPNCFASAV